MTTTTFKPHAFIAGELAKLPALRTPDDDLKGLVLSIPLAGLTVMPLHRKDTGWMTLVVAGVYRGLMPGMKVRLSDADVCSATEVEGDPRRLMANVKEAGRLSTNAELMERATEFTFTPAGAAPDADDLAAFTVKVQYRSDGRWAVTNAGRCWGPDGWDYEPSPSNRSRTYLKTHRFHLDRAVAMARVLPDHLSVNGRTWSQWQENFAAKAAAPAGSENNH